MRENLSWRSRVRVFALRWRWVAWFSALVALGKIGWYSRHHQWVERFREGLNARLRTIADPSHLAEVLLVIGIAVVLALWWLPKWQAAVSQGISVENRFDRENEARKTLAQIVAGVFVLAGLYSSVKTFDLQRKSSDLQREGQITDRFTKAIDQLGAMTPGANGKPSPNLEVRLGGIYALERIAKDSPKDQGTITEVLTAYVRQNAPRNRLEEPSIKPRLEQSQCDSSRPAYTGSTLVRPILRADIIAILTVIGRRDISHDPPGEEIDLHETNLSGADLPDKHFEGANFSGSNLIMADFDNAHLVGASFDGANIIGVNFDGANLAKAFLMNSLAYEAFFQFAHLENAHFDHSDLTGAHFLLTYLNKTHFYKSNLRDADFEKSHLNEASFDVPRHQEPGTDFCRTNLKGAVLDEALFWNNAIDLSRVRHLTQEQLNRTRGVVGIKLPSGLVQPSTWFTLLTPTIP